MIRSLRKKHKFIWLLLALLLPAILFVSIVFRHREPLNESVPPRIKAEKTNK